MRPWSDATGRTLGSRASTDEAVLGAHFVCPSPHDTGDWCYSADGLVPQESSDLLRCASRGAQRVVSSGGTDFLRVARTDRHSKSLKGIRGTTNRCALLRSLMAKVNSVSKKSASS